MFSFWVFALWRECVCFGGASECNFVFMEETFVSLSVSTYYGASWCIVRHTLVLCGQTVNLGVWLDVWDLLLPYLGKCMV